MEQYEFIDLTVENEIAFLTLKREPLNVLNIEMMTEITNCLKDVIENIKPHALVIKSDGKVFSAGVSVEDHTGDKAEPMIHVFHKMFHLLVKIPCPTIAVIDGAAIGGGCELASFCDIAIATEKSKFGQPEISLGLFPPVSAAVFPWLMGYNKTMELLLTGRTLTAAEAKEYGLINQVVGAEELEPALNELLANLRSKSKVALEYTKKAVREGMATSFAAAIGKVERIYLDDLLKTDDAQEGLDSFIEKRKPVWQHS